MPYIQRTSPPPNRILTFSLTNFAGGLNNRSEILGDNQASELCNMAFTNDDVMEKRRGSTNFDSMKLNGEIVFIDEYKPYQETPIMIRATKTELYFGSTKVRDINGQITGVNFMGKYFFADGARYFAYGKFPQADTTYEEVIGTPIAEYTLMQVKNPPNGYVALGTEHTRGRVVYDYEQMAVWYEPCVNELEDYFKNGNALPEKPRYLVSHNGRIFASGSESDDDNVFITDLHNPYYFPASLPMQLPPNSDKVVGMAVFDDSVVIGRREDIYVINGSTNRTDMGLEVFRMHKVNSHTGFANHNAVDVAHNYLFFLGYDGNAYALSGTSKDVDLPHSSLLTRNIDFFRAPIDLSKSDLANAHSIFFEDCWYVTMNDKIMIYSYRHQAWTMYKNLFARSFYKFQNVLIWGDMYGRISMPSEDYMDYGVPYRAYWSSKNFDMGDANSHKQFREFFLVAHTFNAWDSDVIVTFEVDYTDVKSRLIITNQLSIWGKSHFGDRYITRNINASVPFVIGRRGRNIRFTFSNGYDVQATVNTVVDLDGLVGKKEGSLVFVTVEQKYYLFIEGAWHEVGDKELNQTMRVYQMNGDYEFRGKR